MALHTSSSRITLAYIMGNLQVFRVTCLKWLRLRLQVISTRDFFYQRSLPLNTIFFILKNKKKTKNKNGIENKDFFYFTSLTHLHHITLQCDHTVKLTWSKPRTLIITAIHQSLQMTCFFIDWLIGYLSLIKQGKLIKQYSPAPRLEP